MRAKSALQALHAVRGVHTALSGFKSATVNANASLFHFADRLA